MKSLSTTQMESVNGGKLNAGGWICAAGTGTTGVIWTGVLGIACPVAGAIVGLGWGLLSSWACDRVNDAFGEKTRILQVSL